MKKGDYLILSTVLAYSFLFYQQSEGINFLIFTGILLLVLLITDSRRLRALPWLTVALGALASAFNITWQHTNLALVANLISLVALAGLSFQPRSSLLIATVNGLYSFGVSLAQEGYCRLVTPGAGQGKSRFRWLRLISVTVPITIALLFLWLYAAANPVFENLVSNISFRFISWDWIRFTAIGWVVIFGFINQRALPKLTATDQGASDHLYRRGSKPGNAGRPLALKYEFKTGLLLLLLLNLLLLTFHGVDVLALVTDRLPDGVTYSQYVHQGVNTLIASIVLAVAIILYFFRGNLNFFKGNQKLLLLAYFWILQNIGLVFTSAYKNYLYINEYGLTHKRIGVYVYLTLTVFGLFTTFIKVLALKSNWFLFRKNAWLCYLVMIATTFYNWDQLITRYNLTQAQRTDIDFLLGLSTANLVLMNDFRKEHPEQLTRAQESFINYRLKRFHRELPNQHWQSWNYLEQQLHYDLFGPIENINTDSHD